MGANTVDDTARPFERPTQAASRAVTNRLWAYSDGVFAVIVTIMVLQLRPPHSADLSSLSTLWPTFVSYVVSYVFIAIIWINHHYLTRFIEHPSLALTWTNFVHLLFVSLVPFTTAWMAQTNLARSPVMVYAGLFLCAATAYNALERHILSHTDLLSPRTRKIARRRSLVALSLFAAATLASAVRPWLGFGLVCSALVLHVKPDVGAPSDDRRSGESDRPDDPSPA
jgi:uncharacterized membrane protein